MNVSKEVDMILRRSKEGCVTPPLHVDKLADYIHKLEERVEAAEQEIIDIEYSVGNQSGRPPLVKRILERIQTKLKNGYDY